MKFKLYCFLIVLVHPCLGLSSTEPSEGTDAWGSFLKIDRDIPIITSEKARNPILRQHLSKTLVAYEEFRSLIKHKGDWVGADFAQGYFSQLNGDQQMLHSMVGGYSFSRAKYIDIDELDNYSPTAFPQLSSPTKWELAPGNYLMWAENPETGEKSSTQEIPVDRNQECDLAVP